MSSLSLTATEIAARRKRMAEWDKNARLEGIELNDADKELFDMFDEKGMSNDEIIRHLIEMHAQPTPAWKK